MKEKPKQKWTFTIDLWRGILGLGKVNPGVRTVFLSVTKKNAQTQIRGTQNVCFSTESAGAELSKLGLQPES